MNKIAQYRCSISLDYLDGTKPPIIDGISVLDNGKTYNYEVLIWNNTESFTKTELVHFPKLKILINWGTDDCNLDENLLHDHGITVKKIDSYATEALAEYIISLMLMFERRHDKLLGGERFVGGELYGKKIGIIGMGKIGSRAAGMLKTAFHCNVSYTSRTDKNIRGYKFSSAKELFATCDYAIITVKARSLVIDPNVLRTANPKLVILNISRDSVLPLRSLLSLLKQQKIRGFIGDLKITDTPKRLPENVLLSPQRGYLTGNALRLKHDTLLFYLRSMNTK